MRNEVFSDVQDLLDQLKKGISLEEFQEAEAVKIEDVSLPDFYESQVYEPELCKECRRINRDEVIPVGIRLVTPYSYLLLEGCDSREICSVKTFQMLYYGIYIRFPDELSDASESTLLVRATWETLSGERKFVDIKKMIDIYKTLIFYPKNRKEAIRKQAEEVKEFAKVIIKVLMETKLPVIVKYPYPKKNFCYIDWEASEKNGKVNIVEEPCEFNPWEMMCIVMRYVDVRKDYYMYKELLPLKHSKESSCSQAVLRKNLSGAYLDIQYLLEHRRITKIFSDYFDLLYYVLRSNSKKIRIHKIIEDFRKLNILLRNY